MSGQAPPGRIGVTPGEAFRRAVAAQAKGDFTGAEKIYQAILRQYPKHFESLSNLGTVLIALERIEAALAVLRRAVELRPSSPVVHALTAWALQMLDRDQEALERVNRAIVLDPDMSESHATLARVLANLGRFDDATAALSRAIELAPERAQLYGFWGHIARWTPPTPHIPRLRALAEKLPALPVDSQVEVHFALARMLSDCGDLEQSFRHQIEGGSLQRRFFNYDGAEDLRELEAPCRHLDAAWLQRRAGAGDPSTVPVFIVGMPRSGTTLVEQILASHPQVRTLGERRTWHGMMARLCGTTTLPAEIAAIAARWSNQELHRLGMLYVAAIRREAPAGTARIIDKLPANFQWAGLIHAAMPEARIIHTMRDPVDTCLSLFSILFASFSQLYSYDLGDLGRYYRGYQRVMAHWRDVLPDRVMLDVRYEDVVDDLEGQARRIIAHVGLEWDDACLAFHASSRAVRTASHAQVRQPIYRSSVGRPRPPRALLQPLLDALGGG